MRVPNSNVILFEISYLIDISRFQNLWSSVNDLFAKLIILMNKFH